MLLSQVDILDWPVWETGPTYLYKIVSAYNIGTLKWKAIAFRDVNIWSASSVMMRIKAVTRSLHSIYLRIQIICTRCLRARSIVPLRANRICTIPRFCLPYVSVTDKKTTWHFTSQNESIDTTQYNSSDKTGVSNEFKNY